MKCSAWVVVLAGAVCGCGDAAGGPVADGGGGDAGRTGEAGETAAAGGGTSGGGGEAGALAGRGGSSGSAGSAGRGGSSGSAGSAGSRPAAGHRLIVGVSDWGLRGRSRDGASWTYCGNPGSGDPHAPDLLRDVGYGGGVFIAVGGDMNAMVMRSLDGEHWQEDLHPKSPCSDKAYPSSCTNWMGAVAFHDGVWLAGGGNGALMRSIDAGLTWSGLHTGFPEKAVRELVAGSGRFVAGTDGGGIVVTQNGGDAWTVKTPAPAPKFAPRISHGAGTFIAHASADVASAERACFVSSNAGDDWEPCAAMVKSSVSFVHDGDRWVAPVTGGYATSADGRAWTTHAASDVPSELAFDGEVWFGRSGGSVYAGSSPDTLSRVATGVPTYRGWTVGRVLESNLPVSGVPACVDNR